MDQAATPDRVSSATRLRDLLDEEATTLRRNLRRAERDHRPDKEDLATVVRRVEVLWGVDDPPSRGPRATLTREAIVDAAIEIADTHGLDALSMRAVAARLEVGPMSLYRHVPGKDDLVALMLDLVAGEEPDIADLTGTWRERLEAIAWRDWVVAHRHPWVVVATVGMGRPINGPNAVASYEAMLSAVAETGLPAREVVRLTSALVFLVEGATRSAVLDATVVQRTGVTNEEWWTAQDEVLDTVVDAATFPTFTAIAEQGAFGLSEATGPYDDPIDHQDSFRIALATLLDGIAARVPTDE